MAIIDVTELFPLVDLTYRQPYTSKDAIDTLVAHYTVTDMPATASRLQETEHLRSIYNSHIGRGFGGIGYHGIAFPSGRKYKTAPWDHWGANVAGENDHIRGFAGVFSGDIVPPSGVMDGYRELIVASDIDLGGYLRPIKGHRDLMATNCPGGKWQEWVPTLRQEDDMAELYVVTGTTITGRYLSDGLFKRPIFSGELDETREKFNVQPGVIKLSDQLFNRLVNAKEEDDIGSGGGLSIAQVVDAVKRALKEGTD